MLRCWCLSIMVLLSACSSLPQLGIGPGPEDVAGGTGLEGQAGTVEQEPLVSPYQQNQPIVNREAQQRFSKALALMQQKDWLAAEPVLTALVADYPGLSGPVLNLAIALEQKGDLTAAETYYQRAINTNSTNMNAYHCYAVLLRQQGRFAEAEKVYLSALGVWQQDKVSHKNLAILYDIYMGRLEEALFHYQQYLALSQGSDREVQGWVADLSRRIKTVSSVAAGK